MGILTKEQRRNNMQAVKNKGSKIEILLGRELWKRNLRYRKNDKSVFGKPDFVFKKYKVAVFCDSEFWHGKDWEKKKHEHKSNIDFWHKKIQRNIERDKEVNIELTKQGWKVLRFWGIDIEKKLLLCADNVEEVINANKEPKSS